ncbi:MAG: undecaprenyl-diphosphate phosphatase [Bacteroidia bacterium]|nr:undecaprenyl-diphosphate phosphatase [Bacteroidia bacterium]
MNWLDVITLAIVQGLTEFLPISSTGHMILAKSLLGIESSEFVKAFIVNIHFGTMLAVILLYWKRFFHTLNFYYKLLVAFIPAAVIGFLLNNYIDAVPDSIMVIVVALSLLLGGIFLLFVDKWFHKPDEKNQDVSYMNAFKIGLIQCIALIPGVSRSAATIVGGMIQKLNRKNAAEFSFFLSVPTIFAASVFKLLKNYKSIDSHNIKLLMAGNFISFIVAIIAIKAFIALLTKYGFKAFGVYRILLGLIILVLLAMGYQLNILAD